MSNKAILFEPWAMGDALIAASVLTLRPDEFVLACQKKWHPIILAAIGSITPSHLIGVETSYESKNSKARIKYAADPETSRLDGCPVYSIRGDPRDYYVAKRIFPRSAVHMSGWLPFVARKIPVFDLPFKSGLFRVRNRYEMWMSLLGLDFEELKKYYASELINGQDGTGSVGIHVGAQWQSKQYPEVARLAELLVDRGKKVRILAGLDDPLPPGISAEDVICVMGIDLVDELKKHDLVVTNDSGPMHLAALLRVKTAAIGNVSNIDYWAPPSVLTVSGDKTPRGYAPLSSYWTDEVINGWPTPETIIDKFESLKLI